MSEKKKAEEELSKWEKVFQEKNYTTSKWGYRNREMSYYYYSYYYYYYYYIPSKLFAQIKAPKEMSLYSLFFLFYFTASMSFSYILSL